MGLFDGCSSSELRSVDTTLDRMTNVLGNSYGESVAQRLASQVNQHGHGFHYSVVDRARYLCDEGRAQWYFEVAELPVKARNSSTKVDFILRHKYLPRLMIAECKRANPAFADWCFMRAPYVVINNGRPST